MTQRHHGRQCTCPTPASHCSQGGLRVRASSNACLERRNPTTTALTIHPASSCLQGGLLVFSKKMEKTTTMKIITRPGPQKHLSTDIQLREPLLAGWIVGAFFNDDGGGTSSRGVPSLVLSSTTMDENDNNEDE